MNFLLNSVKTQYDKEMLKSRNIVCKNNFFEPMVEKISEIIVKYTDSASSRKSMILDAGCGEGSHFNQVINKLHEKNNINFDGIGIDISKVSNIFYIL